MTDNKITILHLNNKTKPSSVRAKLNPPYLVNESKKYILPESFLLPEKLWGMELDNVEFVWLDEENMYDF